MAVLKRKLKNSSIQSLSNVSTQLGAGDLLAHIKAAGITLAPLDIRAVVKLLGIKLSIEPLDNDISGYLSEDSGVWSIAVNSLHHPRRQRFTIAHELGHYFLHRHHQQSFVDKKLFRNGDSNHMETEANRFAGDILMPEDLFRAFIVSSSSKVEDIAEHFGVSSMAVRVRASQLGFSGHNL